MKSTEMLCCWLKTLYYIILISYHACDGVFDWLNYFELSDNGSFSGLEEPLFCFSCAFGLLTSLGMIVVYGCYITFHGKCIYRGCRGYKLLNSCNRSFNDFELLFSILELLGKNGIQSYILGRFYKSQSDILEEPTCYFLAFVLCRLVAYSKLCLCFITKLCGCGVGEQSSCKLMCESDSCDKFVKVIACFIEFLATHGCDVYFDWFSFRKLWTDNTVSGILISTNSSLAKIFFLISCCTGTVFSLIMIVTYRYYIKFHWYCIHHASYQSARYSDGEFLILKDRECDKKCDRTFVTLELWVSALELVLKDDFQSGILFWICTSHFIKTKPSWYFIIFQACSVIAHLKLGICFMTKFCRYGAREEEPQCCDGSCAKSFASGIGFIGSAVFLVLTVVSG